ncbi:MAG: hypothetical protein SVM80_01320 [Halobacteriota archaeon]|nr:hypothetical protein [Halobacteriota archaeon]
MLVGPKRQFQQIIVLASTGFAPNIELAKESGLDIGQTGGIIVDSSLHVKKGESLFRTSILLETVLKSQIILQENRH